LQDSEKIWYVGTLCFIIFSSTIINNSNGFRNNFEDRSDGTIIHIDCINKDLTNFAKYECEPADIPPPAETSPMEPDSWDNFKNACNKLGKDLNKAIKDAPETFQQSVKNELHDITSWVEKNKKSFIQQCGIGHHSCTREEIRILSEAKVKLIDFTASLLKGMGKGGNAGTMLKEFDRLNSLIKKIDDLCLDSRSENNNEDRLEQALEKYHQECGTQCIYKKLWDSVIN
jgi:hypothetical protein